MKTVRELLTTYDVTDESRVVNERPNRVDEVQKEVIEKLRQDWPNLVSQWDYFGTSAVFHETYFPMDWRFICVFYVRGGSEGYYVHVETQKNKVNTTVFLGKTLDGSERGRKWAEDMVVALGRIFDV